MAASSRPDLGVTFPTEVPDSASCEVRGCTRPPAAWVDGWFWFCQFHVEHCECGRAHDQVEESWQCSSCLPLVEREAAA